MAFTPLTGTLASVFISSTSYAFNKWTLSMDTKAVEVSNMNGSGYRQYVPGLTGGTVTVEGPHDAGSMAFSCGAAVTFILKESSSYTYSVPTIITKIEPKSDVDDAARVSITAQITGSFTASIT